MKTILALVLAIGTVTAQAQVAHKSVRMINSLLSTVQAGTEAGITNAYPGIYFTNSVDNSPYYTTNGVVTNAQYKAGSATNIFLKVPLWTLADGTAPLVHVQTNAFDAVNISGKTYANLSFKYYGGAAADDDLLWRFQGSPDGVILDTSYTWEFTTDAPNGSTISLATNVPSAALSRWLGYKSIQCVGIYNAESAANGEIWVYDLNLNGFIPKGQ